MITIEQLLESVVLNFEPGWVTKDDDGTVNIWEEKPERCYDFYSVDNDNIGEVVMCPKLKLAEFDGKDWTQCIYEVPRKTTGKIEKLLEQKLTIGKTKYEYPTHAMMIDKINELVDAVNELKGAKNE